MKVGDLVRWNATYTNRGVGIITKVAKAATLGSMLHVHWADGKQTKNWHRELEVISETR